MLDQQHSRKNKVNLNDYDYRKDVENRLVINQLDSQDVAVLEEIIYNSIQFPIEDIEETLELSRDELMRSIEKLIPCELFTIDGDQISVNKEGRKHFESHLQRFEEDFSPGIEFVQSLLKGVPIQILPNWYHVPKSSNSIFESLIEKYFHTPQLFERYLLELNFEDLVLSQIVDRVFQSKELKVPASEIMAEFSLTQEQFEEYMLALEFNFVLFSKFERVGEKYIQMILPFHEWREYALFTRSTAPTSIDSNDDILAYRPKEFAFVEDMGSILETIMEKPLAMSQEEGEWNLAEEEMLNIAQEGGGDQEELESVKGYLSHVIQKLIALNLAEVDEAELHSTQDAEEWLECNAEQRAFSTYKHPANQMMSRQWLLEYLKINGLHSQYCM